VQGTRHIAEKTLADVVLCRCCSSCYDLSCTAAYPAPNYPGRERTQLLPWLTAAAQQSCGILSALHAPAGGRRGCKPAAHRHQAHYVTVFQEQTMYVVSASLLCWPCAYCACCACSFALLLQLVSHHIYVIMPA
jgi:hypothetical protein